MADIRISGPQVERTQTQAPEIEKSTFMGRVISNLNSIKGKFEIFSNIFKAKVDELKNFFSSNNERNISAKSIQEQKIKGLGEEVLGTRVLESIGLQRSFKDNPHALPNNYQRFDSNNVVRQNYSRLEDPREKYADPAQLGNSIERYSQPEKNSSPPPPQSVVQKISEFASKIFNRIYNVSANIDFHKADGATRNYTFKTKLGEGAFKAVYLVEKVKVCIDETGKEFLKVSSRAMSIINASAEQAKSDTDIEAEIKVNSRLREIYKEGKRNGVDNLPHVAIAKPVTYEGETAFSSKLMAGGALNNHVKEFNDEQKRLVAQDMCKGLQELHNNGIVHRDVKLDNFLIDDKMSVKISDMGKAFLVTDTPQNTGIFMPMVPPGAHPQSWTKKDDVYQLGVALFQLYSGNGNIHGMRRMMAPNLSLEERQDIKKVWNARNGGISGWEGYDKVEPSVRDFIARMVDSDPNKRPDMNEVTAFFS